MYDAELRAHIQRLARLRGEEADFGRLLTGGNSEVKQRIKNDWRRIKSKKGNKGDKGSQEVGKSKGKKGAERDPKGANKGREGGKVTFCFSI